MSMQPAGSPPRREIHHADAVEWLRTQGRLDGVSVVTSLPDVSELPALGLDGWRRWFVGAAAAAMNSAADDGVAVFFQSDIRHHGVWIDKGALVAAAAEQAGMTLLFHKIVCRLPAGTPTAGRASYAHLLGFARTPMPPRRATPDVLPDGGFVPGRRAMGVNACIAACELVRRDTPTRTVLDPFCGWGTVLAVANALGLHAIGVDHSTRMCKKARALHFDLSRPHEPQRKSVAT
jgi:hypothetical protein